MSKNIFEDQVFEKFDFLNTNGTNEFNNCTFKNGDFTGVKFDHQDFVDCTFSQCNLSVVKVDGTRFNNTRFLNCKIWGVDFSRCSKFLFSVAFEGASLNHSTFYKNELKKTIFKDCLLKEVSFIECNLNEAVFVNCDLQNAIFDRSNLEKADFTSARNYSFNPEINKIKKAKFSIPEVVGLLSHYDISITD